MKTVLRLAVTNAGDEMIEAALLIFELISPVRVVDCEPGHK
ncbi:MAG: hypothetical protein Q8O43_00145 [Dehalococcoidia bacterium]|nr:hypothetical protein [Dehalococcoidia bacterium]